MHELRNAPRQRRSQKSIDAILDAAEWLISERGQVNFTANELSSAAGMSVGRVYYWFPDIPSVVNALVERGVARLSEALASVLAGGADVEMSVALERGVDAMCKFVDDNPSAVSLCLTGGTEGPGHLLFDRMLALTRLLVQAKVPDAPEAEVMLVARALVSITLGMLLGYLSAGESRHLVRKELVYVLSAWMRARYPPAGDRAWTDPTYPIRPSRIPTKFVQVQRLVHPPLSTEQS